MASARYTCDEVIAILKRSSLSSMLVEGTDDIEVVRNLELSLKRDVPDIDFFNAGDRGTVLAVWTRRIEIQPARVSFLADSDLWLFTDDRANYPGVVFTDGYSIENCCVAADAVQSLIFAREETAAVWTTVIENLTKWFAAEIWFAQSGQPFQINRGLETILDPTNGFALKPEILGRIESANEGERVRLETIIRNDPLKVVIGKVLVLAIKSVLEQCEALPVSKKVLLALGSKTENPKFTALVSRITLSFT